jgi:hypothetical protein
MILRNEKDIPEKEKDKRKDTEKEKVIELRLGSLTHNPEVEKTVLLGHSLSNTL